MDRHVTIIKAGLDAGAAVGIIATFAGLLPAVAAGLSALWFLIQIFESKTGQHLVARFKRWFTRSSLPPP